MKTGTFDVSLFNGVLEAAARSLVVLNAVYPRAYDLTRISMMDHLVVHTGDFGGPPSLHPPLPHRSGELLVRRRVIEEGLSLLRRQHLVDVIADGAGMRYRASEEAFAFVELMRSKYARELRARAEWAASSFSDEVQVERAIYGRMEQWRVDFQRAPGGVEGDGHETVRT